MVADFSEDIESEDVENSSEDGDSLHDDIASAFKEVESPESSAEDTKVSSNAKSEEETEKSEEGAASPEKQELRHPEAKKAVEKSEASVIAKSADTSIPPPISWTGDKKELFKQLPRPLQEEVARRELDRERAFTQRSEELAKYRKSYQDIDEAFEPHRQELEVAGISPGQVVRQLLGMQKWMQKEPKAAISHILASYNLTPQDLESEGEAAAGPVDPRIRSLQEELEQLKGYISSQQERDAYQSRVAVDTEIQNFANESDAEGNLAHPYLNDVYSEMLPIADALRRANPEASPRQILDAAYDRAIYSHPEVRTKVISRLTQDTQAKRISDAKSQAQKAKAVGSSVKGSPSGTVALTAPDDIRATIEQAFEDYRL